MRRDVQEIFRAVSGNKQVMMFSATLSKEIRAVCKKFMQNVSMHLLTVVDMKLWLLTDMLTHPSCSPSRFTSTTRPSLHCTVFNNTTSSSPKPPRTES